MNFLIICIYTAFVVFMITHGVSQALFSILTVFAVGLFIGIFFFNGIKSKISFFLSCSLSITCVTSLFIGLAGLGNYFSISLTLVAIGSFIFGCQLTQFYNYLASKDEIVDLNEALIATNKKIEIDNKSLYTQLKDREKTYIKLEEELAKLEKAKLDLIEDKNNLIYKIDAIKFLSDTQSKNELNNLKNLLAKKEEQIRRSMEEHHTLTKDLKSSKDFINELKNQKQDEVNQRKNLERDISSLIKNYESELITLREKAKSLELNISQKISQETASKVKISSLESTVKKLESDKLLLNSNSEKNKNIEIQSINEELIKVKNELSEEKKSKSQLEEELLNSLIAREEDLRRMDELNDLIKTPKNETSDNSFQSSKKNIDDEIKILQKAHRNTKIDPRILKILSEMMVEDRTSFEEQLSLINQNKLTELCGFKKVVSLKYDCKECRFGRQHGWRMYFTISNQQNHILLIGRKSNQERDIKRLSEFTALDF